MNKPYFKIQVRPKNGCARCVWWRRYAWTNRGRCACSRDITRWQAPPCPEYEMDPGVKDDIIIYDD